jgi:hypothetical protein
MRLAWEVPIAFALCVVFLYCSSSNGFAQTMTPMGPPIVGWWGSGTAGFNFTALICPMSLSAFLNRSAASRCGGRKYIKTPVDDHVPPLPIIGPVSADNPARCRAALICSEKIAASVSPGAYAIFTLSVLNGFKTFAICRCSSSIRRRGWINASNFRFSFSSCAARSLAVPARSMASPLCLWASANKISLNVWSSPCARYSITSKIPSPATPNTTNNQPINPIFLTQRLAKILKVSGHISWSNSGPSSATPIRTTIADTHTHRKNESLNFWKSNRMQLSSFSTKPAGTGMKKKLDEERRVIGETINFLKLLLTLGVIYLAYIKFTALAEKVGTPWISNGTTTGSREQGTGRYFMRCV